MRRLPALAVALLIVCGAVATGCSDASEPAAPQSATSARSATAPAPATTAAPPARAATITASGVGGVRLGMTYRTLRAAGLLGRVRPGCELAGPDTRSASLRAPLRGSVELTLRSPRKVATILVTAGATARDVGIGARMAAITAAFPRAKADHSTDDVFEITVVSVPAAGGGRLEFAVSTTTRRVTLIAIPAIAFCE